MEGFHWLAENWVIILNAVGVVGGLFFTAVSLRSETKTRRIANLLTITQNHREIWKEYSRRPDLSRILAASIDFQKQPITREEEIFVNFVILHINSAFHALRDELVIPLEGLKRDVWWFFSLPIPLAIWERTKVFQNAAFIQFVEECRNLEQPK